MSMIFIGALTAYYLAGCYVSCWLSKILWPCLDIEGEWLVFSMALLWMFWPITFVSILLRKHFNESKGEKP